MIFITLGMGVKRSVRGCQNCYMYYLDQKRNQDGHYIYKTQNFNYLIARDKNGDYKIKSGEVIRVCMTSDFFLEEADQWPKRSMADDKSKKRCYLLYFN